MYTDVKKEALLAAGRQALGTIAAWTNFLFDGGAGTRLAESALPPNGLLAEDVTASYRAVRSAGGRIEDSIVLTNLGLAVDVVRTGEWPGTLEELAGVVNALEPFRVVLDLNAITGPYTDPLLPEPERLALLKILDALLARRWLANGASLTLRQIALLAGLSEKTVRMAAIGRDRNPDLATYREGAATLVKAEEAERWLRARPSYRPTVIRGQAATINLSPRTNEQVAVLLRGLRERVGLSSEAIAQQLSWNASQLAAYTALEGAWWDEQAIDLAFLDVPMLSQLARVFRIEQPLEFVRALARFLTPHQIERQLFVRYGHNPDPGALP